jgi:hypothetical protein
MAAHLDGDLTARSPWTKRWRGRYFALHDGVLTWWESEEAAHAPVRGGADGGDDGDAWRPTGKAVGALAVRPPAGATASRPRVVALDGSLQERLVAEVPALVTPLQQAAAALAAVTAPLKSPGALDRRQAFMMAYDGTAGSGTGPGLREPLVAAPVGDAAAGGAAETPEPDAEALVWAVTLACAVEGVPLPDKWRAVLTERYARRRVVHQHYRRPDLPRLALGLPPPAAGASSAPLPGDGTRGGRDTGRVSIGGGSVGSFDAEFDVAGLDAGGGATLNGGGGTWSCPPDGADRVAMRSRM